MMHAFKRVACIRKDLDKCLRVVFSSWEVEMSKRLWLNTIYKRWEWLILQIRTTEQYTEFPCLFNLIRLCIITGEKMGFFVRTEILHFNLIRQSQDEITNSSSRRHVLLFAVLARRWTKTKTLTLNEVYLDGLRCNYKRNVFQQLAIQRRCEGNCIQNCACITPCLQLVSQRNLELKFTGEVFDFRNVARHIAGWKLFLCNLSCNAVVHAVL